MVPFVLALFRQLGANRCNEPALKKGENYVGVPDRWVRPAGGRNGTGRVRHDDVCKDIIREGNSSCLRDHPGLFRRHSRGVHCNLTDDLSMS